MTSLLLIIQSTDLSKTNKNILKNIEKQLKIFNSYDSSNENNNRALA